VKNTLAVVQAIAMQTDGSAGSVDEFREKFIGRLQALARTHGLLLETQWRGTDLRRLVDQALEPFSGRGSMGVEIEGGPLPISTRQSLGLSLVLHELETNAAKYGALSVHDGMLHVSWTLQADNMIRLVWREAGGPSVTPPTRKGFGAKLIERVIEHEIGAKAQLKYEPEGLVCEIVFPQEASLF
jgi:two-component sensor histidine kinase